MYCYYCKCGGLLDNCTGYIQLYLGGVSAFRAKTVRRIRSIINHRDVPFFFYNNGAHNQKWNWVLNVSIQLPNNRQGAIGRNIISCTIKKGQQYSLMVWRSSTGISSFKADFLVLLLVVVVVGVHAHECQQHFVLSLLLSCRFLPEILTLLLATALFSLLPSFFNLNFNCLATHLPTTTKATYFTKKIPIPRSLPYFKIQSTCYQIQMCVDTTTSV